jgi:hypothetical protein
MVGRHVYFNKESINKKISIGSADFVVKAS